MVDLVINLSQRTRVDIVDQIPFHDESPWSGSMTNRHTWQPVWFNDESHWSQVRGLDGELFFVMIWNIILWRAFYFRHSSAGAEDCANELWRNPICSVTRVLLLSRLRSVRGLTMKTYDEHVSFCHRCGLFNDEAKNFKWNKRSHRTSRGSHLRQLLVRL